MIVELVSVLAVFIGGCALMRSAGITGWALPALGFLAGTSLQIVVGTVQVITFLPTAPILTLAITAGVPLAWWATRRLRGHEVSVPLVPAILWLVTLVLAVVALRAANLVNWHTDSFRYLMIGRLLAGGEYPVASTDLLTKRLLAVSIVHAPANLTGDDYLRSVVPLLAAATVAALVWFFRTGTLARVDPTRVAVFAGLGALLLITTNRFVFHAFYLNGHLLFGALVLVIVGSGWLLATTDRVSARALMALPLLAIPALVVTRAEATPVAVLAVLPTLLSERIARSHRIAVLATLAGSIAAWHAYVAFRLHGLDLPIGSPVLAGLALGMLLLALIPLLRWRFLSARAKYLLWLAEAGLWVGLLALTLRRADVLRDSLDATIENQVFGAGSWGASVLILGFLVLGLVVFIHAPHLEYLRFPLTTFVPLVFLLPYLRDGAYRVGDGDSLNRMLIQAVPLAILYVIVAMSCGEWRFRRVAGEEGDHYAHRPVRGGREAADRGRPAAMRDPVRHERAQPAP